GIHGRPGTGFLQSFDDDSLAGLDALGDDVIVADTFAEDDTAQRDFVVFADHVDYLGALDLSNRFLRNQQRVLGYGGGKPDTSELTGAQDGLRIRKFGDETERAGLEVNGAVSDDDFPLVGERRAIGQNQLQFASAILDLALVLQALQFQVLALA